MAQAGVEGEVVAETQPDFLANHVGLSCTIAKNSSLPGYAAPLKLMFKAMLLAVLCTCKNLDKVKIVAALKKNLVSINFDTGLKSEAKEFKHWPLGKLHSVPFNTEGIGLAAIDAMARFHQGHLSVCHHKNQHDEYMLSFKK